MKRAKPPDGFAVPYYILDALNLLFMWSGDHKLVRFLADDQTAVYLVRDPTLKTKFEKIRTQFRRGEELILQSGPAPPAVQSLQHQQAPSASSQGGQK